MLYAYCKNWVTSAQMKINIVLLGDSSSGKTSLMQRAVFDQFKSQPPTINVSCLNVHIEDK